MAYILIGVLAFALLVLALRHARVKQQIRHVEVGLRENPSRPVSIELFDRDIEKMALAINRMMEKNSQSLLETEKNNAYLKRAIADISHDMRTPLTSIIGYLQLIRRGELSSEQLDRLDICLDRSAYLQQLLTDFYELSALQLSDDVVALEMVDLPGVISEVILENAAEFDKQGVAPIFPHADVPVFIMGNMDMVRRVIENIVSNCLEYASGDVVFSIARTDAIELTIENPAHNVGQIDVDRIFDRFYKADSSRTAQGTGLGLAIVKLLMEKQGGAISAHIDGDRLVLQLHFSDCPA